MGKIEIAETWLEWLQRPKHINSYRHELEGIDRLIEMENSYPYKGDIMLKYMIKKKIILQCKIKLLEESGVVE